MKRTHFNTLINYYTKALIRYWINEWIIFFSSELTLVYTMAKVGSTSFYSVLRKGYFTPVFHIHSLDVDKFNIHKRALIENGLYPDSRSNASSILKHIQRKKKTTVITLVREPIARNVSAFFEVLEFYLEGNDVNNITIQELYDIYQEKLPHNYPLVWFDNEIKKYLDIDIYSYPYELYKKYIHINRGSIDLLVLRTDAEEGDKLEALSSITKMEIKAIPRLNVSNKKYYSKKYDQFVSQAFPLEYINQMLDSTYAKHFYTSSELTTLRKKWAQCLSN